MTLCYHRNNIAFVGMRVVHMERKRIAVILAYVSEEYAYMTLCGIEQEAFKHGMDVYVFNADASNVGREKHNAGEYNIYNLIDYSAFEGVILLTNLIESDSVRQEVLGKIRESGIPAVSVDAEIEGFSFAGVDNYQPMKEIVAHLIEVHGFTKINCVSGPDFNADSRARLAAYCDAMREHGLPVEEKRIFKGDFSSAHGRSSAEKMLKSEDGLPEAVVCADDLTAISVRAVFAEHGINIPGQVALTGFDNSLDARFSTPRLTTVYRDQEEAGKQAVLEIVHGAEGNTDKGAHFASTVIFRESCGCCADEKEDMYALCQQYLAERDAFSQQLEDNIIMVEKLNESDSLDEFLESLHKQLVQLKGECFYLCLNSEFMECVESVQEKKIVEGKFAEQYQVVGYSEMMAVPLAYEGGKRVFYEDFPSKQMIPQLSSDGKKNHTYFFSAVHFTDRCMGYTILVDNHHAMSNAFYLTWRLNLCNGLESLRKQEIQKSMLEYMNNMYVTDSLTGLYNRFGLAKYGQERYAGCALKRKTFMLLFADMDDLKHINDKYGHGAGDEAIFEIADALKNACVAGEICGRFGGDEFVVCADNYTMEDAAAYGRRLEDLLRKSNERLQRPYKISVSYGFEVGIPELGESLMHYVDIADKKMYVRKKNRKECASAQIVT